MGDGDKAPTRPSYCHPWSDGVTHWLTESLAGIVPLEPGFGSFAALPHVSGSAPTVAAERPTPHGTIAVSAERDNARGTVVVDVKASVAGYVGLRLADERTGCALDLTTVTLSSDDMAAAAVSVLSHEAVAIDALHPNVVRAHAFVPVGAGRHTVTASFRADCAASLTTADALDQHQAAAVAAAEASAPGKSLPSAPPFPPAVYPASWTMESETGSDWTAKYGKEGYVLPGFDAGDPEGGAVDLTKLPPWVGGVTMFKSRNPANFVGSDAANTSYLTDPRDKSRKALGFITNGQDGSQGTVVDINVTTPGPYKVTLVRPAF